MQLRVAQNGHDSAATDDLTSGVALPWILRLRYGLTATEAGIVVLAIFVTHASVPLWPAVLVILITSASNFGERYLRKMGIGVDRLIAGLFCLDILGLTAILMLTGGASNPFSLLYLVQITLSATILSKRWTWFLGLLSTVCFAGLFEWYVPVPLIEGHHGGEGRDIHLIGMWVGFAVAAFLIALFSGKISEALRAREARLLLLQQQLAAKQRLASLATLAAGAAHELATPLATIAVISKELEHFANQVAGNEAVADDSRLIRSEVERCRRILEGMGAQGAGLPGEMPSRVSAADTVRSLLDHLPPQVASRIEVGDLQPAAMLIPAHALVQSLCALVKNGADAVEGKPVQVEVANLGDRVRFTIRDQGPGIPQDVLKRIGEPFFTTKSPGKGMGLGTFLVRSFAECVGGSLEYRCEAGRGTAAILEVAAVTFERESFAGIHQ